MPDTAWQFFWWSTSPGCKLEGEWVLEADHDYPNERAWTNKSDAKVTFEFEGSEVWPGCAPQLLLSMRSGSCPRKAAAATRRISPVICIGGACGCEAVKHLHGTLASSA